MLSPMKLGLIGCSMHWSSYAAALQQLPGLEIAAVATAAPDERLAQFDNAPGVNENTRRFDSAEALLAEGGVDVVQVSTRVDLIGRNVLAALEHEIPVMAEKPLAFSIDELHQIHVTMHRTDTPLCAMHGQRGSALIGALRDVVQRGGVGKPLVAHSQKSYKWGKSRPESFRDRATFPGIAPLIGIHPIDWMLWILGDRFAEVTGSESNDARPEWACASHAAYLFQLTDSGMATLTMDYLRPEAAPSHGDERIRVAGTKGVVEISTGYGTGTLIDEAGLHQLEPQAPNAWYAGFLSGGLRGRPGTENLPELPNVLPMREVFRATEVALQAQVAVETGKSVDLRQSEFR
jgi:predicted dehydrogenase